MNKLQFLFNKLNVLEMKYQKFNETSLDSFNIFSILRKSDDEVNLHSKFIYELLNPHGSHKQGDIFLKLFLQTIELKFETFGVYAFREKYNIDILLQSKKASIIIENKIHTQDHSEQLSKYLQTIQNQGYQDKNIHLIYLTLFDEEPNEIAIRDRVINISYSQTIKIWIENCIKEVALFPTIRETLMQYLNLINKLTQQSQYKGFILEVKDFLLQENNLQTLLNIEQALVEAKIEVQLNFWKTLRAHLTPHYPFKFYSLNGDSKLEKSVHKYYKKQKNRKDYGLEYQIDDNLYFFIELRDNIYYGFYFLESKNIQPQQEEKLNNIPINWEDNYWKYPHKKVNFEKFNTKNVLDLIDAQQRETDLKTISDEIIYLIQHYHKES